MAARRLAAGEPVGASPGRLTATDRPRYRARRREFVTEIVVLEQVGGDVSEIGKVIGGIGNLLGGDKKNGE